MAYEPINWQTGNTITADKLNRCDNGWSVASGASTEICNESVTTTDDGYGAYSGQLSIESITADTILVTFDSNSYTCQLNNDTYGAPYDDGMGAFDWSTYPFAIYNDGYVTTQTGGVHTIVIVTVGAPTVETSDDFRAAVESFVDTSTLPIECVSGVTTLAEMNAAYGAGRILFFRPRVGIKQIRYITSFTSSSVTFIPSDQNVTATFDNDVFTVTVSA